MDQDTLQLIKDLVESIELRRRDLILPSDETNWQAFAKEQLALEKARKLINQEAQ